MFVIYVCLKREKNLTLKTCAPDFSARSMTKLYAKIKGARAISLFDFPKTWQVWTKFCSAFQEILAFQENRARKQEVGQYNLILL